MDRNNLVYTRPDGKQFFLALLRQRCTHNQVHRTRPNLHEPHIFPVLPQLIVSEGVICIRDWETE